MTHNETKKPNRMFKKNNENTHNKKKRNIYKQKNTKYNNKL